MIPLVVLSDGVAVGVDATAWFALSVAIGWRAHRLPLAALAHDRALTRLRPWERDGRWYERRLRIGRWKGRLPEGGDVFADGFSKATLRSRTTEHLERFVAETRRAELVHWQLLAASALFGLWNRPALWAAMVAYAIVANLPFIAIQRYNRARLLRILDRRAQRSRAPRRWAPMCPTISTWSAGSTAQ